MSKANFVSKPSFVSHAKRSVVILTLALFSAAVALAAESSSDSNPSGQLPAGAMQEKAAEACSTCHEARIIVQQR